MAEMTLRLRTEDDKQSVYLELQADGMAIGHIYLTAPILDRLIRDLARHRSELTDQVPLQMAPGTQVEIIINPAWQTRQLETRDQQGNKIDEPTALALRHPGLGWLSFLLPPSESKAVGEWLLLHSGQSNKPAS
jgi:hypothetical protein